MPTEIRKFILNPEQLLEFIDNNKSETDEKANIFVAYDKNTGLFKCRGVEIHGFKKSAVSTSSRIESAHFFPNIHLKNILITLVKLLTK